MQYPTDSNPRRYNIARSPETVLSAIQEGRVRVAGSIYRARMRSSSGVLTTMYVNKEAS
jgi:hypothetical protein